MRDAAMNMTIETRAKVTAARTLGHRQWVARVARQRVESDQAAPLKKAA